MLEMELEPPKAKYVVCERRREVKATARVSGLLPAVGVGAGRMREKHWRCTSRKRKSGMFGARVCVMRKRVRRTCNRSARVIVGSVSMLAYVMLGDLTIEYLPFALLFLSFHFHPIAMMIRANVNITNTTLA